MYYFHAMNDIFYIRYFYDDLDGIPCFPIVILCRDENFLQNTASKKKGEKGFTVFTP